MEGGGVREVKTHLQQVHTIRLHAIHPLTDSLFHDLSGNLYRSKYTPFRRANDFDRRLGVFDGSALSTMTKNIAKEATGGVFGCKRPCTLTQSVLGEDATRCSHKHDLSAPVMIS